MLLTTLLLAMMLAQTPTPVIDPAIQTEQELIGALQLHFLKKVGCYRYVNEPKYLTRELTDADCGKPQEIDIAAWNRAEKLAKKLFKLAEEK